MVLPSTQLRISIVSQVWNELVDCGDGLGVDDGHNHPVSGSITAIIAALDFKPDPLDIGKLKDSLIDLETENHISFDEVVYQDTAGNDTIGNGYNLDNKHPTNIKELKID